MKQNIKYLSTLFLLLVFNCCSPNKAPTIVQEQIYLFYLHGRIIEEQGVNAISEEYGAYQYLDILKALSKENIKVLSEARPRDTNVEAYAAKIVAQIQELIASDVPPENITVLGASKGAVIAMNTSTKLANSKVHFVIMGNCNEWVENNYNLNLYGDILSIYEKTDEFGNSCHAIKANSLGIRAYKEIELTTNLRHGFLFKPLDAWVLPTIRWAKNENL